VQHCQIVIGLFLPASQESPKAVNPRMRSLHHPSSCFESRILFPLHDFLATRFDVRRVVSTLEKLTHVFRVVTFVETDVLMPTGSRLRARNRHAVESCLQKLDVMRVGTAHLHTQGDAATVGEYRSLRSQLAAISRVFACIFPRPEAIWSSLRQRFANSTQSLLARRTPADIVSTTCETHPLQSTVGNNDATYFPNHTLGEPLSTSNRFAIRRKCPGQRLLDQPEGVRPDRFFDNEAARAASAAKVLRGDARNNVISVSSPLDTPPCRRLRDKLPSVRRWYYDGSVVG
jgi:hypothetical protein